MKILLFLSLFLLSNPAFSLTCANDYAGSSGCASNSAAAGDCETLGFSMSDTTGCEHYLRCPYDTHYKRCAALAEKSCQELGFTLDDKSSWCNSIVNCPGDSTFTLCAGTESCADFTLTECPEGGICDDCGTSGSSLKYKLISCQNGYVFEDEEHDSCIGANCSGYSLTKCPENGSCSTCLSGLTTVYKLDSCAAGWKTNPAKTACINKSCEDYGYQTMNIGYMVCDTRYSVKIGPYDNAYCFAKCRTCGVDIEPNAYLDMEDMCRDNPDDCFTSTTSSFGYNYGSCTIYESDYECTTKERCSDYFDWY